MARALPKVSAVPLKTSQCLHFLRSFVEKPFSTVVDTEFKTGPRKRAGFALRPGRFPASGRGGGNDGDSGAKR